MVDVGRKKTADELYAEAENAFVENRLGEARTKVNEAEALYVKTNYTEGISKSRVLIRLLGGRIEITSTTTVTETTMIPYTTTTIPKDMKEDVKFYGALILIAIVMIITYRTLRKK
ncbi:MAG: hypothetical protein NTU61_03785 [Candidatus Altiarchaeota archaeon]|nr:hypothetical protein [Candidatus Altiarchaeota archaeon]